MQEPGYGDLSGFPTKKHPSIYADHARVQAHKKSNARPSQISTPGCSEQEMQE